MGQDNSDRLVEFAANGYRWEETREPRNRQPVSEVNPSALPDQPEDALKPEPASQPDPPAVSSENSRQGFLDTVLEVLRDLAASLNSWSVYSYDDRNERLSAPMQEVHNQSSQTDTPAAETRPPAVPAQSFSDPNAEGRTICGEIQ
jgi:hypothetical protein